MRSSRGYGDRFLRPRSWGRIFPGRWKCGRRAGSSGGHKCRLRSVREQPHHGDTLGARPEVHLPAMRAHYGTEGHSDPLRPVRYGTEMFPLPLVEIHLCMVVGLASLVKTGEHPHRG